MYFNEMGAPDSMHVVFADLGGVSPELIVNLISTGSVLIIGST
jgi:hypothetical protein